jgi:hypothetical protein
LPGPDAPEEVETADIEAVAFGPGAGRAQPAPLVLAMLLGELVFRSRAVGGVDRQPPDPERGALDVNGIITRFTANCSLYALAIFPDALTGLERVTKKSSAGPGTVFPLMTMATV